MRNPGTSWNLESTGFGGRLIATNNGTGTIYAPHYQITDHLGSVRVVFDANKQVKAQNDYYAFGLAHENPSLRAGSDTENRFLYNGKENQVTGNLGLLDYGARMYDSELSIWRSIDPLAEKYYRWSPYHFSGNNPIILVDMTGMDYEYYFDANEEDPAKSLIVMNTI